MKKIKNSCLLLIGIIIHFQSVAQNNNNVQLLLDEVSTKMSSYTNMQISFNTTLSNEDAGITEEDEAPIFGNIALENEKYNLNYLNTNFIFDGKKLYIINHEEKEISINQGDFDEEDGFIYPSKLLTFYKEGYTYTMGKTKTINGKKIQFIELTPIDSNSEIVTVQLGIELKTKHIYKLIQLGTNTSKTTFTITSFKSNQQLLKNAFFFDKENYLKKEYSID
ncbi:MAG: outer membrane lipoprotein carrier protein LolA [Polaribacter sp.]|nr:outer membrane lipoprotein carrier protein LolA [Polaribacter sp.]